jgi:competence protein ComFB
LVIKNDMEYLVKAEVRKYREKCGADKVFCRCPLCEADIYALALNHLPPRYCQEKNFGFTATQGFGDDVRKAVDIAVQKVNRRPKHRPGKPPPSDNEVRLENYALKIGDKVVGTVLSPESAACGCGQCQADLLAYALNRYPPKYGVSYGGRESYQANYEDFIRHEVSQALTQAIAVIRERPHH